MFNYVSTKREYAIAEKLNTLHDLNTFWDNVRNFTKNIHTDSTIRIWEWLSEIRYAELLTNTEDVRIDDEVKPVRYYTWDWKTEVFPING